MHNCMLAYSPDILVTINHYDDTSRKNRTRFNVSTFILYAISDKLVGYSFVLSALCCKTYFLHTFCALRSFYIILFFRYLLSPSSEIPASFFIEIFLNSSSYLSLVFPCSSLPFAYHLFICCVSLYLVFLPYSLTDFL